MTPDQEHPPGQYPYDPLDDLEDPALDLLRSSKKDRSDRLPHLPTFARQALGELKDQGLLHRRDTDSPANVRRVKVGREQELWLRIDTRRADEGYTAIDVVDAPRQDSAILAAMTAWAAKPIDYEQVLEARRFFRSGEAEKLRAKADDILRRSTQGDDVSFEEYVEAFKAIDHLNNKSRPYIESMGYLFTLLDYYKPGVKNYSPQELDDVFRRTSQYVNEFLEALRRLQQFLEYGAPNKKLAPAIREPQRDVNAAVLHDVDGLTYREIGERMRIPLPPDYEVKGEHQTVRKMVERGRGILQQAFAGEGWQKRVEAMKAEKARWQSLSHEEQEAEWKREAGYL